jgi:hypothetical protein
MITNRTYYYLYPTIEAFGTTFLQELKELTSYGRKPIGSSILGVYIVDVLYYKAKRKSVRDIEELLFMVIDHNGAKDKAYINASVGYAKFLQFLKYVRKTSFYIDDYTVEEGHCFVFKVPRKFSKAYTHFLKSEYSKMYTKEQLNDLGYKLEVDKKGEKIYNFIAAVLLRDKKHGLKKLAKEIQSRFNTDVVPDEPDEYDLPWEKKDEFLHYKYLKNGITRSVIHIELES